MGFDHDEIDAAIRKYLAMRDSIDADGKGEWSRLAEFFTDDAVFIDPAWGRVEGIDEIRSTVLGPAMVGLEDWKFPTDFYAVVGGDTVIVKWRQQIPGADGKVYEQSGCSTMVYAGKGKFRYEEDLLNMAHVMEDLAASAWKPKGGTMNLPPKHANRDFSGR